MKFINTSLALAAAALICVTLAAEAASKGYRTRDSLSPPQLQGSQSRYNKQQYELEENSHQDQDDVVEPIQERSARPSSIGSAANSDDPAVGNDESSAVDPEFNDLTGDSSDKLDAEMDSAGPRSDNSGSNDADDADEDDSNEGGSPSQADINAALMNAGSTGKYLRAQSQYHQMHQPAFNQQPQASRLSGSITDQLMGHPGNFNEVQDDDEDDSNVSSDSNIDSARVSVNSGDLATAASHHGHKHYVHGWLKMGAHTGKKGSFGWHDKHPVGGKGRR